MAAADAPLLVVDRLSVRFPTRDGMVHAVTDVSFELPAGATLGVVGESGSGKTQMVMAMLGLLPGRGRTTGRVVFEGTDLLVAPRRDLDRIRGRRIGTVFQDPMTALNPFLTVRRQMTEVLLHHEGLHDKAALARSVEMLDRVGIPDARRRIADYPHEFSGGQRQRIAIAIAMLCRPRLLIADEPTTALDVTVQAQVLELMRDLVRDSGTAIILISHDLGAIAGLADGVMVMYGGRMAEIGMAEEVFRDPAHPYTQALLAASPRLDGPRGGELATLPGQPPSLVAPGEACAFAPRCARAFARCKSKRPTLFPVGEEQAAACFLYEVRS
ncbi:ABC transporter ATP-binding protein [Zavarzinia sp. CC-PAN008]|uniref:ABC transporter ATP-binding protein n=1 Tax=Zavarzinia sp. CC-PAN008 TaxID=3243332 RepID=UPI003F749E57